MKTILSKRYLKSLNKEARSKGPKMETLKKNKVPLTDEERKEVMDSGAVWHYSPSNKPSPAVWKAEIDGKFWYVCNTHRAYQCKPTLKGAIKSFEFIETTSFSNKEIKISYRPQLFNKTVDSIEGDRIISILKSYIDFITNNPITNDYKDIAIKSYFNEMITGIEVEKNVGDKMKGLKGFGEQDRDIIQHLKNLPPIPNTNIEEQKNFIKNIYETYNDQNHTVRGNLFFMDSIPEVKFHYWKERFKQTGMPQRYFKEFYKSHTGEDLK